MPDNLKWCSRHDSGNGAWLPREQFKAYPTACTECRNKYDRKMRRGKQTISQAWASCKHGALARGVPMELTKEQFVYLANQPCAYGKGRRPDIRIALDRKDNSLGYTLDNSAPCCPRHNEMKRDWYTSEEFKRISRTIRSARQCGNTKMGTKIRADLPT